MMMNRFEIPPKVRLVSILVVLALFLFYFFIRPALFKSQEEEGESAALEEMEAQVKTAVLKTGGLPVILNAMGTCVSRPQSPVAVVSRIQDIVKEVSVLDGQAVKSGQIIARLDSRVARSNYEKAQAAFQTAEGELQNAEKGGLEIMQADLDVAAKDATVAADQAKLQSSHEDELLAENLTSGKSAQDAKAAMEIAVKKAASETKKAELFRSVGREMELKRLKAAFAQTQAELKAAQLDLDSTVIRSPLTGRIGGLKLTVGAPVDSMTVIARVSGENTMAFRLWISPQNAQELTVGFPVSVYPVLSNESIPAKIVSIGGGLDEETGLVPVDAQPVEQIPGNLRINEAVTAHIITSSNARGFLVPVSSLTIEDDKASVFLVDDKRIAHAVPVNILSRSAAQAVVEGESLKEGAPVIVDGNYNLPDGAHVSQGADK
jgi:multidrug efflux pump subunit AcrA (membrane-fusion protein)